MASFPSFFPPKKQLQYMFASFQQAIFAIFIQKASKSVEILKAV
jgi:hypothetical protein